MRLNNINLDDSSPRLRPGKQYLVRDLDRDELGVMIIHNDTIKLSNEEEKDCMVIWDLKAGGHEARLYNAAYLTSHKSYTLIADVTDNLNVELR